MDVTVPPRASATNVREVDLRKIESICAAHEAVMLFGSVARGDAGEGSDVDVLAIAARSRSARTIGRISLTLYTEHHLRVLAHKGSLFVCHLRAEGRVLQDRDGAFQRIFHAWRSPDIARARAGMNAARAVLDLAEREHFDASSRLRVALYLLRSALYLRGVELGQPVFAMHEVAASMGDDRIALLYSRQSRMSVEDRLALAMQLLERYLPEGRRNPFGSLEALAVNWSGQYPMAADLALQVLTKNGGIDYAHAPVDWGDHE